jgi:ribonuclease P protein component
MVFPYSLHWQLVNTKALPERVPAQVLIATSKKKFHHAVDRNRVKRLTRECYRLHKPQLYEYLESNGLSLVLAINYVHNEILDFATLMHKFDKLTTSLIADIGRYLPNESCQ